MIDMTVRGCIIDTSHTPPKTLDGTHWRNIDELEQLIAMLDLLKCDELVSSKQIRSGKEYTSTYKIKESRNYED